MEEGTLEELLLGAVEEWGPCDLTTLSRRSNLTLADVQPVISDLARTGGVTVLGGAEAEPSSVVYSRQTWERLKRQVGSSLADYYVQYPLRKGMSREEIRSRLGLSTTVFPQVLARLVSEEIVAEDGALVRSPNHETTLSPEQERQVQAYIGGLESEPFSPPTGNNIDTELLSLLIDEKKVVKVDGTVVFSAEAYRRMVESVTQYIGENGKITVAEARTLLNSSRKYVLPLLEYLDQQRITRRRGDERVLR